MKFRLNTSWRLISYVIIAMALKGAMHSDASGASTPNVVLIMADDLGYEAIEAYGGASYSTPNIDQLAQEGVRFDYGYAQPLCTPTRTKIMTGKSNLRNYEKFNIMNPSSTTFGHVMQDAGYKTTIAGKWQLHGSDHRNNNVEPHGSGMHPSNAGFDSYMLWQVETFSQGSGVPSPDDRYWGPYLNVNGTSVNYANDEYASDLYVEHINNFITDNKEDPFFVYYPMVLTHDPFMQTPLSPGLTNANRYNTSNAFFGDMVEYMDYSVGKIVDHLEAEGLRDNTIILFLGDNGTKSTISSQLQDGSIVTGAKGQLNDQGTRVPFIASWTGGQTQAVQGTTSDSLVDIGDIMATLANVSETNLPSMKNSQPITYDSRSFLPQIQGEEGNPHDWLYTFYDRHGDGITNNGSDGEYARNQQYKLYGEAGFNAGELYDISADPDELSPLDQENLTTNQADARQMLSLAIDMMHGDLAPVSGDANGDFRVDEIDLDILNNGDPNFADFNDDGAVDQLDRDILLFNWGQDAVSLALNMRGDFNLDGEINRDDWAIFLPNLFSDVSNLTPEEAYRRGDLIADGTIDRLDFVIFKDSYNSANGLGSFGNMLSTVPEPSSELLLLIVAILPLLFRKCQRAVCY